MISKKQEILLLKSIRKDPSVYNLITSDKDSEIFINKLSFEAIKQLNEEFPKIFQFSEEILYSITIISSKMTQVGKYMKIRIYTDSDGKFLKKMQT